MPPTSDPQVEEARLLNELEELAAKLAEEGRAEDGDIVHDAFKLLTEQDERERNIFAAENTELRIDRQVAEQRIKKLEKALEIAVSCVGNYAADSNLGEALAAVGINRHPEEDSDEG
jgi:hypothetical protein